MVLRRPTADLGSLGAAMLRRLEHRGPDDHGWLCALGKAVRRGQGRPDDDPLEAMLLHRRLSILDLSEAGRQPMSSADGRYHIVFNGEIYNYIELRGRLQSEGIVFHTQSDTEVLLAALVRWGVAALPQLVGMFAFALLDTHDRTLLLARDFFGIKPLYYYRKDDCLAFASEIKTLLEIPQLRRNVDPSALYDFLCDGICDHAGNTMFAEVKQFPSAHYAWVSLDKPGEVRPQEYWRVNLDNTLDITLEEAAARLRQLFSESIRLHLRSDVPVGSALSGGIDSSAIVAMARAVGGKEVDFHSFSFLSNEPHTNEGHWVDIAGAHAGMTVHKTQPTPQDFVNDLDQLVLTQDEPFGGTSIYAQYCVFRLARDSGVKVLLDGQGADEMLAGYYGYLTPRLARLLGRGRFGDALRLIRGAAQIPGVRGLRLLANACLDMLPGKTGKTIRGVARGAAAANWINHEWFAQRGVQSLNHRVAAMLPLRHHLWRTLSSTSLPVLLRYEDRNSMAFGIESRVPFLTPQLVEFVLSLPDEHLISPRGTTKHVFRQAMRGIVPDAILDRRDKIAFEAPSMAWLTPLRPWIDRTLDSEVSRQFTALRYEALRANTNAVFERPATFDWRIWRWVNVIRWAECFGVSF